MNLDQVIKKVLKEKQDAIVEALKGGAKSFDEYRYLVGKLDGMTQFHADISKYLRDPDQSETEGR
jgi:hypothetical protein